MIIKVKKVLHGEKVTSVTYEDGGVEKTIEAFNVDMRGVPNTAVPALLEGATVEVDTFTSKSSGKTFIGGLAGQKKAYGGKGGGYAQKTDMDYIIMLYSYAKDIVIDNKEMGIDEDKWVENRWKAAKRIAKTYKGE